MYSKIDLHIHSIASDGSDTIAQLLEKLLAAGIHTFSVTDHDTMDGTLEMEALVPGGLRFLRGIEFSCQAPRGKSHILGYDFRPDTPAFQAALAEGAQLRHEKLLRRMDQLESRFDIRLTREELQWLHSQKSPGKPHFAQLLVKRGLAPSLDEAIRSYLDPVKVGRDRIDADGAIRAITAAGGVPVWAHPLGGEGERRLSREEFLHQLEEMLDFGIRGLECHYSRYSREDAAFLTEQARSHGLLISGGSDYHGVNKANLHLGKLNVEDREVEAGELSLLEYLTAKR